jgi:hypothetical protein
MKVIFCLAAAAVAPLCLLASPAGAETIPLTAERWEAQALVSFVEKDGRQAVLLGNPDAPPLKTGAVTTRDVDFSTGRIEYDVIVTGARDFVGFTFREKDGNGEYFYIRPLQSGNPDATQYTPVVNGSPAWQIFSGDGFTSAVRFTPGQWMHVRADIYPTSASVSIDGAPALAIPHLKSSSRSGSISLLATAGAYFSNFSVTPIADYRDPNPAPPPPPLPAGSVTAWLVSPAMTEEDALARAAKRDWAGVEWKRIPVESHGVDNLSLAGPDTGPGHTYLARFTVTSPTARSAKMDFGFSDKVRVFLNGRPLFEGSDVQSSRDYRFLGIVGFWDTLFLPLEAGANEIAFVVTDGTNGGTAAAARFEPDPSLRIE